MKVVLVGFMGSGKTTTSRLLGTLLNEPVYDIDAEVERYAGKNIPTIFAEDGEKFFRELEHKALYHLSRKKTGILATGGGTLIRKDNLELIMNDAAPVILLEASPQETLKRLRKATNRPLARQLTLEKVISLQGERNNNYRASADLHIKTDDMLPKQVAALIKYYIELKQKH